jgi:hypothetical protein
MSGATMHVNNEATIKTHLELPLDSWSYTYQILLFFVFGNHWAKKKKNLIYLKGWRNIDQIQIQELNLKIEDTIWYGSDVKIVFVKYFISIHVWQNNYYK